ncbi:MAG TPA: CHASE3 domain-containing protein [Candidatus Binatia bacterium]|nr:CHASE3 domain-containing protein [Candidatus Binatia bacterium]
MDERSFQALLRRTIVLPVVLLVLLAATLAGEFLLLSFTLHWVDHSDQIIATARQCQRSLVEMDTVVRGYYLTGDAAFLQSYAEARSAVPDQLELLHTMTADNPGQQQRLQAVHLAYLHWMEWADQQVRRGQQNPASDRGLLAGQQLMQEVRARQRVFVSAEEALRRQRSWRARVLNATVFASAVGLSLLIGIVLFTRTRRELLALSSTYERHLHSEAEQKQQLKESREWFQITLKSLGEAVVSTDEAGRISFINPAAQQLTGWDYQTARGRPFGEVVRLRAEGMNESVEDPVEAVRRAQHVLGFSNGLVLTSRNGKDYPIELTGAPILKDHSEVVGVAVVLRDVTQRRLTEQTLRSSERLTLAGRLSATIAHEIRNPLDTVTNLVYLLRHEQKPNPVSSQYLEMASDELARIAQITGQLLTFHREARSPVSIRLTEVLESVLVLFAPQIRQNHIAVDKRFETEESIRGFPGELRQVFSNLIGNAIDAMARGGTLILHVRNSSLVSDPSRKGVRVTVLDSGSGIPIGVRRNLFAPFYTTKGEKGTGLGLWISRSIVEKHEGTIHVSSTTRVGQSGTAFSVFLPFEQRLGLLDVKAAPPAA